VLKVEKAPVGPRGEKDREECPLNKRGPDLRRTGTVILMDEGKIVG